MCQIINIQCAAKHTRTLKIFSVPQTRNNLQTRHNLPHAFTLIFFPLSPLHHFESVTTRACRKEVKRRRLYQDCNIFLWTVFNQQHTLNSFCLVTASLCRSAERGIFAQQFSAQVAYPCQPRKPRVTGTLVGYRYAAVYSRQKSDSPSVTSCNERSRPWLSPRDRF